MDYRKMAIFMGIAFVLYFWIAQPTEVADFIRSALGGAGDAAAKLADFVRRLVR